MPQVQANGIDIYYEVQGEGEPMVLIPYLAADQACYAFQVAEYAKHYTCFSVDLRGAGASGKPDGVYTTELLAADIAAFMQAAGIEQAHIFGLSLGAATGMWLAARHPEKVKSLSLHSGWTASDPFLRTVVDSWQIIAQALASVPEMIIQGIFPWCFTPEMYAARPEYVDALAEFVRGRRVVRQHRAGLPDEGVHRRHRPTADELGQGVDVLGPGGVHLGGETPGEDPLDDHLRHTGQGLGNDLPALHDGAQERVAGGPGAV